MGSAGAREEVKVTKDKDVGAVATERQQHPARWCLTSPWHRTVCDRLSLFL